MNTPNPHYQVETYTIDGWEDEETGLLLDENDEWLLLIAIPVDYITDGYKLINKKFVTNRSRTATEMQIEKVLGLRNFEAEKPAGFAFGSTVDMLRWVEQQYEIFEFQDDTEDELFYGKIHEVEENELLIIDYIDSEGYEEAAYEGSFDIEEIRAITFDSDYFKATRLLWKSHNA